MTPDTFAALRSLPDGTIYEEQAAQHRLRVVKHGDAVLLFFVNPDGTLDGPMSRVALDEPLALAAPYLQAQLLTLLWVPQPARICVLGFGGGRLPLVLHTHLPDTVIDSVDVDAALGPLAERFFGMRFDPRQRLHIADGRAFLAAAPPQTYDIIVLDAFSDARDPLLHLATAEFAQICAAALTPAGVLTANLLRDDPLFPARLRTLLAAWPHTALWEHRRNVVLFAGRRPLPRDPLTSAVTLARRLALAVPLAERAAALRPLAQISATLRAQLSGAPLLTDKSKAPSPAAAGEGVGG